MAWLRGAFHEPETRRYQVLQGCVWALIFLSIGMLVAEPLVSKGSRFASALRVADRIVLAIFALEYLGRTLSYEPPALNVFKAGSLLRARTHLLSRIRYALRPMMLIDLMAVLAFFPELRGLRALRLLRLVRTAKLFRYSNPFASIFHAFESHSLLFIFGFTVLIGQMLIGGLSIYLVEGAKNPSVTSILDGFWWALVTLTTVGYGDVTPTTTLGRLIAGFLMVGGMVTLALFAGVVGASLVNAILEIRGEQFRMGDYANHLVICGYDETTELLLLLLDNETDKERRVVIFDDQPRPTRGIPSHFLWVEGDPTKQSELDKVRLTHANAVIIAGARDLTPQAADAKTILTAFTIRAYLNQRADQFVERREPLYVVAEILDSENVNHARSAGADEVMETRRVGFSMLAHTVRYHGTADTMSRVLMSGSYNAYMGEIPDPPDTAVTYGELLVRMRLSKRGGLVIGLRTEDGTEIFNPTKDLVVEPGTHLVYLSEYPLLKSP
jgi:voltage-gated potassium channel Kch